MEEISTKIASWPRLDNGIHYKWLVDYAAFSRAATTSAPICWSFSANRITLPPDAMMSSKRSTFFPWKNASSIWEKRDLIVNFKGNSELTTETDHQQAVGKAIDLVTDFIAHRLYLFCH